MEIIRATKTAEQAGAYYVRIQAMARKLERGSIEQFYHNVDTVGAGEEFKTRIDVLELEETLAVVRVLEEGWGGSIDFTDVLLLLKIDGEWKCVAKAYNQNSNTIQNRGW